MGLREQIARAISAVACGTDAEAGDTWSDWLPEADAVIEVLMQQKPAGYANCDEIYNLLPDRSILLLKNRDSFRSVPLYLTPGVQPAVPGDWQPVAWREFDGEGGYDYRSFADNEDFRDEYIRRNGDKYASWIEPLYLAPGPASVPEKLPINGLYDAHHSYAAGWNDAIDAMIEAAPKPEDL